LYQEALQKLGRSRFVENFRRLLERYYLDLSLQAHTNLQRATINLLRSRWARIRISQCVVDILQPENEEAEPQIEQYIIEAGRKVLDMESWIATNEGLAPPLDDIDDALIYEESSDDEDDEEENSSTLPNVSQMEEFLIGGDSFERVPKRKSALEIKINSMEFAWGIQAQHTISMVGLVVYHILILVGTLGFWVWWMRSHPEDLQSAAVPLTTVAVFLSLFWSAAGVLKVLREPV
jgi:hypothetical protein